MSNVVNNQKTEAKVIPLNAQKNIFTMADFFATYGEKTNSTFVHFLDGLYRQYQKTTEYQYLSFGEKVDVEFKYKSLRQFILHLRR
jgi:hypothetical protein